MLVTAATAPLRPRRRPRLARLPRQRDPERLRAMYTAELAPFFDDTFALVRAQLVPQLAGLVEEAGIRKDDLRLDDWSDRLAQIVQQISARVLARWPHSRLADMVRRVALATSHFQREQLLRQFRHAFRVDPFLAEPWLPGAVDSFTASNVALIKTLPRDALEDVHARVVHGIRHGERGEALARMLQERHGVARNRARLIGRDQVHKFYSDLNRLRQRDLGVRSFVWRTMGDNRVCPICDALDGQTFSWDAPPAQGIPGDCHPDDRCIAEPVLADVWAQLA